MRRTGEDPGIITGQSVTCLNRKTFNRNIRDPVLRRIPGKKFPFAVSRNSMHGPGLNSLNSIIPCNPK